MDDKTTEKLMQVARRVNERRMDSGTDPIPQAVQSDFTPAQWAGMLAAFFGIVSFPMLEWIGGLQTIAGALLVWVFFLIQDREIARQSSAEYMLRLFELRDEFAAYKEKYGPTPEEAREQRRAYAASLLHPS